MGLPLLNRNLGAEYLMKKWKRSSTNRMFAGVLGGLSEAIGINAFLVRIGFVILIFATAILPMAILYGLLMWILPNEQRLSK